MPDFQQRHPGPELLDDPTIPFADIQRNMAELEVINTWLGGHAINLAGIRSLGQQRTKHLHLAEVGCGAGDNLRYLLNWSRRQRLDWQATGIDINPHAITLAQQRQKNQRANWILSDYKDHHWLPSNRPDIIFASLCCHHFSDLQLVHLLGWMRANASIGFFINDLHRHRLAYYSIQTLTRLFSRSYLVKHDAPLSVLRGFTRSEWAQLLHNAGITTAQIQWRWAFRHLITVTHER